MAGKSHRKGISLAEISKIFATEEQSREWLENRRWTKGVICLFCEGKNVVPLKHPTQTHRCKDCRNKKTKNQFNVKTNTVMEHSNIPCRIWAIGIYLYASLSKSTFYY
ncbi:MAG: transposase [Flavobacteriaceae bacterium]|nr:transposase [Flavobacteriaceae bacterium]